MGRHLLTAPNGVIVEWSSVVDAPVAAFKSIEAARTITVVEASVEARAQAERQWAERATRLDERGTTALYGSPEQSGWKSRVEFNRAGRGEKEVGAKALLALVTRMAEENEAGSAEWLAQNDVKHAVKAERRRIVALVRVAAETEDANTARASGTSRYMYGAARDALLAVVAKLEET